MGATPLTLPASSLSSSRRSTAVPASLSSPAPSSSSLVTLPSSRWFPPSPCALRPSPTTPLLVASPSVTCARPSPSALSTPSRSPTRPVPARLPRLHRRPARNRLAHALAEAIHDFSFSSNTLKRRTRCLGHLGSV